MKPSRRWYLVLPPSRICHAGVGLGGNVDLHLQTPEYSRAVHYNATYSRPLFVDRYEADITGPQYVVVTGRVGFRVHDGGGGGR